MPGRRRLPGRAQKPGYGDSVRSVRSTLSARPARVKTARSMEMGPLDSASPSPAKLRSNTRSAIPCFILSQSEATVEADYSRHRERLRALFAQSQGDG